MFSHGGGGVCVGEGGGRGGGRRGVRQCVPFRVDTFSEGFKTILT